MKIKRDYLCKLDKYYADFWIKVVRKVKLIHFTFYFFKMNILDKIKYFLKKNIITILLVLVLVLAFGIRINNIFQYNTWWADDGGAHIEYIEHILDYGSLPSMSDNYLAWHEPLYYIFQAVWTKLGLVLGISSDNIINWQEFLGLILFGFFIFLVHKNSMIFTQNRWLALLNVFVFSILFSSVKLSAYVNNEFPVQILIILLVWLFFRLKLLENLKNRQVIYWSVLLGLSMLIKLTAFLVLLSVILLWFLFAVVNKKKYVLVYILLSIMVVSVINLPWLAYKKINFDSALTINIYEQNNKQKILTSDAWDYIFKGNNSIFVDQPFWVYEKYSFFPILLADIFTDYYNLFNHVDEIKSLPEGSKIMIDNGQFSTPFLILSGLWSVRVGLVISLICLIGFFASIYKTLLEKRIDWQKLFLYTLIFGGLLALIYNNLRFPYPERGVLKVSFIFYILPLISVVSYGWWWQVLQEKKWLLFAVLFLPWVIYFVMASPILFV